MNWESLLTLWLSLKLIGIALVWGVMALIVIIWIIGFLVVLVADKLKRAKL
jgi:hypothetical protein